MLIETGIPAPTAALDPEIAVSSPALQKRVDHTLS